MLIIQPRIGRFRKGPTDQRFSRFYPVSNRKQNIPQILNLWALATFPPLRVGPLKCHSFLTGVSRPTMPRLHLRRVNRQSIDIHTSPLFTGLNCHRTPLVIERRLICQTLSCNNLHHHEMKPKRGRPSLPKGEAKGEVFSVRLAHADALKVHASIKRSGLGKPDWLRESLIKAAKE